MIDRSFLFDKRIWLWEFVWSSDEDDSDERLLILDTGDVQEDDEEEDEEDDRVTRRVWELWWFVSSIENGNEDSSKSNVNGEESVNGDACWIDWRSGSVPLP